MEIVREYGGARWHEAVGASMHDALGEQGNQENAAATFVEIEAAVAELERALRVLSSKVEGSLLVCYRGSCDSSADVRGYNRVTHGLYCMPCARRINRQGFVQGGPLYPLINAAKPEGGAWSGGIVQVRHG